MILAALVSYLASANAVIHLESPGVAVRHAPLQGIPLCVWNDSSLFTKLKPAMQERGDRVFRFPNGSYSDTYHWNGTGTFDADTIWVPSSTTYSKGGKAVSIHRGITTSSDASLIDDGDTSTYWWSNPDHPASPGWFYMDLGHATVLDYSNGTPKAVDSIALWLGTERPDSIQIVGLARGIYPYPYQQKTDAMVELARLPAAAFVGLKFAAAKSLYYVGVRPLGARLAKGWQVREMQVFAAGTAVSKNLATGSSQTPVYATSGIASSRITADNLTWDFEAFMRWIKAYPGAQPMVCVNFGTGTPQEAAAWVHYANKVKNYGIKRWQVGNESSGQWEENGCVSARQYSVRYVQFARAMRAEDASIEIEGPVLAGTDFTSLASGDFDGRTWAQGFLHYVDSVEKATGIRLVHGFDFHSYPYWTSGVPQPDEMLAKCDAVGDDFDSLVALMGRSIADPAGREILMTEFNTTTMSTPLQMQAPSGVGAGLQFAHFIRRFGDRGVTNTWELYSQPVSGTDGYGTLGVFLKPTQGEWSSLTYAPNASFWTTRAIARQWLDEAGGDTVVPVDPVAGARLFAVRNHGRVSVLAFNLGPDSTSIQLDPSLFPAGGDVLSWGTGEYLWSGTTADARAVPNNGPSSRAFAAWGGSAKIPPYGMLVVRGAGRAKQAPRNVHWLASSNVLTVSDTLVLSGWTTGEQTTLAGGTWSIGNLSGPLTPTDGAWDGPSESWVARIPAADIGAGDWILKVSVTDNLDGTAGDSTSLQVSGTYRPVGLVADFEAKKAATNDGYVFYTSSADGGKVSQRIVARAGGTGFCMRDSMTLTQPADKNYTNFGTNFSGFADIHQLDSAFGLVGLMFDINTTHSSKSGTFGMSVNLYSVKDYDNYSIQIPNTKGAWIRDTVLFNSLSQGGWGATVPWNVDSISGLGFNANGAGVITFMLDNIYFLGSRGEAMDVGVARGSAARPLALVGRNLSIDAAGPWLLRIVSPDGRVSRRTTGSGASTIPLSRSGSPCWAVLEADGKRQILSLPPMAR